MTLHHPIWFMRHGQTNYNELGLCNDDPAKDVHLTEQGIAQTERAAEQLRDKPLKQIIASPLLRTRQTANIINRYHDVPVIVKDEIIDIHSGFDSKPVADYFAAIAPDRLHLKFNNGESLLEHKQRIIGFLEKLIEHKPQGVLVVAHEETLRVVSAYFESLGDEQMLELHFNNCEILQYEAGD
ncbi:MAG: histidine phosphatase family protein [Thioalkalispiraceae bacterium]|jgi:broad specificity phosphatase PhoE